MEGVATLSAEESMIGRRVHSRHRLNLTARFVGHQSNLRVQIEDLSIGGACVRLMHPQALAAGQLCWLNFAVYGEVIWRKDVRCGLRFEEALSDDCLAQTLEFGEMMLKDANDKFLRLASAWTHGPGDW